MTLKSPVIDVQGAPTVDVEIRHRYNTETCCDHGYIVYRTDGGAWNKFVPTVGAYPIFDFMYNDPLFGNCGFSKDIPVFSGDSLGYIVSSARIPVATASTFELMFLYTSDASFVDDGWYIDSVEVTRNTAISCTGSTRCLSSFSGGQFGSFTAYPECGFEGNGSWVPEVDGGPATLWASQTDGADSAMVLLSDAVQLPPSATAELIFDHRYDSELFDDVGYVAFRQNGGPWQHLGLDHGGYSTGAFASNDPFLGACGESPFVGVFSGMSSGYLESSGRVQGGAASSVVEFGFLYTSDALTASQGWYLDDVAIGVSFFADGFEGGNTAAWSASNP
jgi:hypothetical protein